MWHLVMFMGARAFAGAVWSAHTSADMVLAYGCEDGTVFTVNHVVIGDKRGYRPPHTAVFGASSLQETSTVLQHIGG